MGLRWDQSTVLLLGLVILSQGPGVVSQGPQDPAAGPAWWDEQWPFRVLVEAEGPVPLPNAMRSQGSEFLASTISFQDALERAGWPEAVELPADPSTVVVVPYFSLAPGAQPGNSTPRLVLDPVEGGARCEAALEARCFVVWEAVPGALAYGIYWGPPDWEIPDPQMDHLPRPIGHTRGHEHWVVAENFENPRLLIQPPPSPGEVVIQVFEPTAGWLSSQSTCAGGDCPITPAIYRLVTQVPSTVTVYEPATLNASLTPRALAFSGGLGPVDDDLGLALPGGSWDASPSVAVWPDADACVSRCTVRVEGQTVDIRRGSARTVSISPPSSSDAASVSGPTGERIHAATVADGLLHIEPTDSHGTAFIVPIERRFTVVANESATLAIRSLSTGERIQDDFQIPAGVRSGVPVDPKHDVIEIQASTPIQVYTGSAGAGIKHHQPIPPTAPTLLPAEARLFAVAPRLGEGSFAATVTSSDGRESRLRIPAGTVRLIEEGTEEPAVVSVDTRAPLGLLSVRDAGDESPLLGQALSVMYPQRVEPLSAAYAATVVGLSVEPSSQFAGASSVASFNVTLSNLARGPGSDVRGLSVTLDVVPVGVAADLGVEATIGATRVSLASSFGSETTVPLHVRVPGDVADTVLTLEVVARVEEEPRLQAVASARVSVVTIRDFTLAFQDGSKSQARTSDPGIETVFPLVIENTGTVPLDLLASHEALGDERFETCLARTPGSPCEAELVLDGLPAGASRTFELHIRSPDVDEEARVDVRVRGELAGGRGPVRNADATLLLNVPVAAHLRIPDLLELPPGGRAEFPLVVENLGVQSRARLTTFAPEGPVRPILLEEGVEVEQVETLLGPSGTTRATWEVTGVVQVSPNATPGRITEGRFLLELEPGGGLPPFRNVTAIPVRVVRIFDDVEVNGTVPPGIPTQLGLPLEIPQLGDASVRFRVLEAPPRWTVEAPETVVFDANGTVVSNIVVTPPPAHPPGPERILLQVEDPLGPGGAVTVRVEVRAGGVALVDAPGNVALAVGDVALLEATVENVGNRPLDGRLSGHAGGVSTSSPPIALDPGEATTAPLTVNASAPYQGELDIHLLQGTRKAGTTTISVLAENASLELAPAAAQVTDKRVLVTASVTNQGGVPVRNLTLGLAHGGAVVREQHIQHLPPGRTVPVPIEWIPESPVDPGSLTVRLDPAGRLTQDSVEVPVEIGAGSDTPAPGGLIVAGILSGLALWTRRHRGG